MQHNAAQARFRAQEEVARRVSRSVPELSPKNGHPPFPFSAIFGESTFNARVMREKLSTETFQALQRTIRRGEKLQKSIAGEVAHAIKEWALEMGATHFCHWFQPQTGLTAEKHDAFISFDDDGVPIERFSGSQLIQSEPDASSFPSGGMRSTFEARGYTAWDPSSPLFIMDSPNGRTLCVPSVFISYHGLALDKKTPLLRSMDFLGSQALEIVRLFGNETVERVVPTLGAEQEYFLVDRALYQLRPDLISCGRTLCGAPPPKGQQLEDHYFGSIKSRVLAFIQEAEYELYRLGVPVKTRHNEVAPNQYELAPVFEEANVASDHNQLVMEILRSVASRHNLALLLHEKPFAGVNGSGKHCNWSLMDSQGNNLLQPGTTRAEHLRFLVFIMAVLRGVQRRAGLLRASVAISGNDHRLGANEAPPAIISVFLGEELNRLLDAIEGGELSDISLEHTLHLNISKLPDVDGDITDRNRTSPFAFTGSKFEFRAVPSSAVVATPITYLNAAVGEALQEVHEAIRSRRAAGLELEQAVLEVVREVSLATRPIRFDGNNYDPSWVVEAEQRGLPNLRTTPQALEQLLSADAREFFEKTGVYSAIELESRFHVKLERYIKDVLIEASSLKDLVRTFIVPAAVEHQAVLAGSLAAVRAARPAGDGALLRRQEAQLEHTLQLIDGLGGALEALEAAEAQTMAEEDLTARGHCVAERIVPALARMRLACDRVEETVADSLWPLPKYRELLLMI